jgi:hypothetical protein
MYVRSTVAGNSLLNDAVVTLLVLVGVAVADFRSLVGVDDGDDDEGAARLSYSNQKDKP